MPIMESMSQDEFEEVRNGIKKWLELRQNQVMYSDKSPSETIEDLLQDLSTNSENNLLPWEMEE